MAFKRRRQDLAGHARWIAPGSLLLHRSSASHGARRARAGGALFWDQWRGWVWPSRRGWELARDRAASPDYPEHRSAELRIVKEGKRGKVEQGTEKKGLCTGTVGV